MDKDPIKSFRTAFEDFLKEENLTPTYKQKKLIANWEQVMGRTISSRTEKLFFKEKVLFIKVSSAPLKNEMLQAKQRIMEILENELGKGEVKDVRLL
ncbi:MAG: DUF721 domain-containing protein [Bacteroidota bacterium]